MIEIVAGAFITCRGTVEELGEKFVSPLYTAVTFRFCADEKASVSVAVPPTTCAEPSTWFVPDEKRTVPVGVPLNCGTIVAASVTCWLTYTGVGFSAICATLLACDTVAAIAGDTLETEFGSLRKLR